MRLSVLVTHSQNCDQVLARPLRRAVVMEELGEELSGNEVVSGETKTVRVPQPWPAHATEGSAAFLEAFLKFSQPQSSS
jgi:hypothetical protein